MTAGDQYGVTVSLSECNAEIPADSCANSGGAIRHLVSLSSGDLLVVAMFFPKWVKAASIICYLRIDSYLSLPSAAMGATYPAPTKSLCLHTKA